MGWTSNSGWTRKSLIAERVAGETNRHGTIRECLAHCYKGAPWKGSLWSLWKLTHTDGSVIRYIGCDLLQCYGGVWCYKDLEAGMGLNQINCPLSYLLMGPFDYDYEKGYFIEWVGEILNNYKKKDSPLYKKVLKAYPNAIQLHLDAVDRRAAEPPFIPKKMVNFSEIVPKDLLKLMAGGPVAMLEAEDRAYDQMIIDLTKPE